MIFILIYLVYVLISGNFQLIGPIRLKGKAARIYALNGFLTYLILGSIISHTLLRPFGLGVGLFFVCMVGWLLIGRAIEKKNR